MTTAPGMRPAVAPHAQTVLAALVAGTTVGVVVAYQPLLAIGLVVAPLFAALALYRLPLAVAVWIPVMFIEGLPGSRLGPELLGLLVGVGWVAALRIGSLRGSLDGARGFVVALCAMLTWFALSLVWAHDVSVAAGYVWYFAEVAIFLVIIATVPRDVATMRLFIAMYVVGAVISVAIGLSDVLSNAPTPETGGRLQGGAGDPNYFAAALMPALALTIGMTRAATTRAGRYWSLAATLPLIFGIAASQSRGAFVAAGVMAIVALVVFPRERWMILLCVCTVTILGATYFVMNPSAAERITNDRYGGSGRTDLWRVGTRIARDNPVLGVGLYNYKVVSPSYVREPGTLTEVRLIQRGQEAHNVYLGMLLEVGLPGLLLFLAVPFVCLRLALRAARRYELAGMYGMSVLSRAAFVGLTGALTTSFFLPNAADKRLWILMGLIIGLSGVARRVTSAERADDPALPAPKFAPRLAAIGRP